MVIALLVAGLGDAWLVGPPNLKHIFTVSQPEIAESQVFRQQAAVGARFNMTHTAQANMGVLDCYEYTDITTNAKGYDQPGYKGEQYLVGPGTVQLTQWTPNALSFDVIALAPSVLIVNQNYDYGWHLAHGRGELYSNDGLISVRLPSGKQRLVLAYVSNPLRFGVAISLLTLAAMLVLLRYERSRGCHYRTIETAATQV